MPNAYVQRLLSDKEQVLFVARQHWFILARNVLLEIVTMVAVIIMIVLGVVFLPDWSLIIGVFGGLVFLIPLITIIRDVLNWTNREYIITTRRVMQISGIFNKTVSDSSLEKVNDVKMVQSVLGRMFNYGDVEILTASELGVNLFRQIESPVRFKTAMLNAKQKLDDRDELISPAALAGMSGSGPENIPALLAQLDALRQGGVLSEEEFQAKKAQLLSRM